MTKLNTYEMEFRTDGERSSRYVRIKDNSYKGACKQFWAMYVSVSTQLVNTELLEPDGSRQR